MSYLLGKATSLKIFNLQLTGCFSCFQISKRNIINENTLKIDHFRKEKKFFTKKYGNNDDNVAKLKQILSDSIRTNSADSESFRKFTEFLFFAETPKDFELILDATKFLKKLNKIPTDQYRGLGSQLMRVAYVSNNSERAIELLNDQDLSLLFQSGYPRLILMNKLMLEEKYVQVVELFENYLQHVYKMEEFKNVKSERKADNPIKFMFPNDQFDLVTMALLKMNSSEALEKMKRIVDLIKVRHLEYVNLKIARLFVLAIKQCDPNYGLKLLKKFENINSWLSYNLTVIAFTQLGLFNETLRVFESMLKMNVHFDPNDLNATNGKFFPFTIECLEIALQNTGTSNKSQIENCLLKLKEEKLRILDFDLIDYCHRDLGSNSQQNTNKQKKKPLNK